MFSLGRLSAGHRNLSMYQVLSSTVFFFVSYMHIIIYMSPLECIARGCFQTVYILLNMTMFVGSQSFISLPSFMFVSAPVSEIIELNQNKKENSEIGHTCPWLRVSPSLRLLRAITKSCVSIVHIQRFARVHVDVI